jgi:hypothetical protein
MSIEQVVRLSPLSEFMGMGNAVFVPSDDGLGTSLQPIISKNFFWMWPENAVVDHGQELAE